MVKYMFSRKMAVANMFTIIVTDKNKTYAIDLKHLILLFQRLFSSTILRRDEIDKLSFYFFHELYPFPPRLFESEIQLLSTDN